MIFEKEGRLFTGGEDLQVGDVVRLVDKRTLNIDGNSWDDWGEVTNINEKFGSWRVKVEHRPEIRRDRGGDGYSLFWEIQTRLKDFVEDQPQLEDDDL